MTTFNCRSNTLVAIAVCLFFLLADSFWGDKTKLLSSDGSIVLVRNKCGVSKTSFNSDIRVAYIASGKSVKENEFFGCSQLEIINFHPELKTICSYAFAGCEQLHCNGGLTFPDKLKTIGEGAFLGCKRLKKIELPRYFHSIGKYAFAECSGLEMVTIGKSCTNIGENAFKGCKQITLKFLDNESVQKLGLKDNYSKWGLNKNCKIQFPNGSSMSIEDFIKFVQ